MAEIDNPQTKTFCNEEIRPAANKLRDAYLEAKEVLAQWTANPGIVPGGADLIADGSETDGRLRINGDRVSLLVTRLQELVADYEANNFAKLNTIMQVATARD